MTEGTDLSAKAAELRELALSRAAKLHPIYFVLDDDLRAELATARAARESLEAVKTKLLEQGNLAPIPARKPEKKEPGFLGDPEPVKEEAPSADHMKSQVEVLLDQADEVVAGIEKEIEEAGCLLTVNFVRLRPADYQKLLEEHQVAARKAVAKDSKKSYEEVFTESLKDALLHECFAGATTADGEDLGLTLDELLEQVLDHGDLRTLKESMFDINRAGAAVPFALRNSGSTGRN